MIQSEYLTEETGIPHMGKTPTLSPELSVLENCEIVFH